MKDTLNNRAKKYLIPIVLFYVFVYGIPIIWFPAMLFPFLYFMPFFFIILIVGYLCIKFWYKVSENIETERSQRRLVIRKNLRIITSIIIIAVLLILIVGLTYIPMIYHLCT